MLANNSRHHLWISIELSVAVVACLLVAGCGRQSVNDSSSKNEASLKEPSVPNGIPSDDSTNLIQFAVEQVVQQQSRSIAIDQPIGSEHLTKLGSAHEAAELLLDQGVIDDDGVKTIVAQLPNLEHLRIRLSPITDAGAEALGELTHLRVLNLPQSKVGAVGIQAWSELPDLEHIRLGGSQIDNAAAKSLAMLPNLQSLHLIGPSITEEGLQILGGAKKLSSLYVDDSKISEAAWQQLRGARPDIHIHLDQQHRDRL
jgi:Leucine-rich repeat (LRR) protein